MPICEECHWHEATMIVDDGWICECCTSGICDDPDHEGVYEDGDDDPGGQEYEHDLDCRCEACREEIIDRDARGGVP